MEKFFQSISQPDPSTVPANFLERGLDAIGLMRGDFAQVYRVVFGFSLVAILEWALKPSYAFEASGAPRPWRGASGEKAATWASWWFVASAAGLAMGLFI